MIILQVIGILISVAILSVLINGVEDYHKNIKNRKIVFPLEPTNSFGIPIIKIGQQNKDFYFIVDTGANLSSVNANTLNELESTKLDATGKVYGMEGNVIEVPFTRINFNCYGSNFVDDCQIVDLSKCFNESKKHYGVKVSGILGSNFLKKYNLIIDLTNNILYQV